MQIWVGLICTVAGIIISSATFYINQKTRVKNDITSNAERNIRLEVKIDNIHNNLNQIMVEQKEMSNVLNKLNEKVALLEQFMNELEKRINRLESASDMKNG